MSHGARRTVRVKVTFEVNYEVPAAWDAEMIDFHLNESSFCMDTLLERRLLATKTEGRCACEEATAEILPPPGPDDGVKG